LSDRRRSCSVRLQRCLGRLTFFVLGGLVISWLRWRRHYSIDQLARHRHYFAKLRQELRKSNTPLLVCANHLTMIDSIVLQWSFGSFFHYLWRYSDFIWNVPAKEIFANNWYLKLFMYLSKCIPIDRWGAKEHHEEVMAKIEYVLKMGDPFLVFPEGGRSRTGRFNAEQLTYGVGRIMMALPNAKVLCVYMRSHLQESHSDLPEKSSCFQLSYELIHPTTNQKGLRAERDLAVQIGNQLTELENSYFKNKN